MNTLLLSNRIKSVSDAEKYSQEIYFKLRFVGKFEPAIEILHKFFFNLKNIACVLLGTLKI